MIQILRKFCGWEIKQDIFSKMFGEDLRDPRNFSDATPNEDLVVRYTKAIYIYICVLFELFGERVLQDEYTSQVSFIGNSESSGLAVLGHRFGLLVNDIS